MKLQKNNNWTACKRISTNSLYLYLKNKKHEKSNKIYNLNITICNIQKSKIKYK
ncbi:hypothetical protein AN2V17_07500 [Vallitalea sp. AN17-2]|uniref:Uncharacterized protein n=1 Tax=Vallitalea maricola TaxID=3074433 RepID=A0ACB5UGE2_9FIRM|nr:hypothetical protein AN2V17_07500 [Vallitalea sp. AN17-2]